METSVELELPKSSCLGNTGPLEKEDSYQLYIFNNYFCRANNCKLRISDRSDIKVLVCFDISESATFASAMKVASRAIFNDQAPTREESCFVFLSGCQIIISAGKMLFIGLDNCVAEIDTNFSVSLICKGIIGILVQMYQFDFEDLAILRFITVAINFNAFDSVQCFFQKTGQSDEFFKLLRKVKQNTHVTNESKIYAFVDHYICTGLLEPYYELYSLSHDKYM